MVTINENISFEDSASRIRLPDCSKFAINQKNDNDVTIFRHDVIVKFFKLCFIYLVKFSYWSKFNVSIITGSRIIIIFFYKEFTRNLEIGNTPVWFLLKIWRLRPFRATKSGNLVRVSLIESYWMLQNARVTAFTISELLRENQQGGKGGERIPPPPAPPPPRLGLNKPRNYKEKLFLYPPQK